MAAYATIITEIDDAILEWIGKPITITVNNRSTTYRSVDELIRARRYYAKLSAAANNGKGFKITHLKTVKLGTILYNR